MDIKAVIHAVFFGLLLGLSVLPAIIVADTHSESPWVDVSNGVKNQLQKRTLKSLVKPSHQNARIVTLDHYRMRLLLGSSNQALVSRALAQKESPKQIPLPLENGSTHSVSVVKSDLISERLSQQYNIKAYRVLPDEKVISGRISLSPNGFHAMLQMRSGDTYLIDPQDESEALLKQNYIKIYVSYRKQDQSQRMDDRFSCGVKSSSGFEFNRGSLNSRSSNSSDKSLLTYKIAIAATGEYVEKKGGTVAGALAAIVTTLSRVNQVYENDLGIHLQLVDNNDLLIYTDANTDPYNATNLDDLIAQNQSNINSVIGVNNYDVGHLFATEGGGLAAIGGVCNQYRKAQGVSGVSNPSNDSFNLDFVAHEIGHQLGATHTFNGLEGLCSSSTRTARTAFEPGSGSTVMSYAGYCGIDNLQSNSDAMFHIGSINQIREFTSNDRGSRCGIRKQAQNSPPTVNAGRDYSIPAQTPFELIGTAEDNDGDQLVFAWEQIDTGEQSQPNNDTGDNALFRVYSPSISRQRVFPSIGNIINHSQAKGEVLPIQQRALNFSFVAQDGFNAAISDEMSIQVLRTGSRFSLNMPRTSYTRGETHKVLWNTANTEKPPINCDAVDVSLSSDGGFHFDTILAQAVPNIGESWVTIPTDFPQTNRARFKLKCSNNIFFAVSYRDFIVNKQGVIVDPAYTDEDQPETSLNDRSLEGNINSLASIQGQSTNQNIGAAAGSLGFLFFSLPFLLFIRKPKIKN